MSVRVLRRKSLKLHPALRSILSSAKLLNPNGIVVAKTTAIPMRATASLFATQRPFQNRFTLRHEPHTENAVRSKRLLNPVKCQKQRVRVRQQ